MFKLYMGECLEIMETRPPKSIDLVLCDLPYGTTKNKWDSVIPFAPLWEQYARVTRPGAAIVLTASQPFTSALVMSNPAQFRYEWIWSKNNRTGYFDANRKPLKAHESVLVFCSKGAPYFPQMTDGAPYKITNKRTTSSPNYKNVARTPTINTGQRYPTSILNFPSMSTLLNERGMHPTQKPQSLMEYLIKTYTNEGDTVLDNCMGSGTTGAACGATNRRFIGIEKDPAYFATARGRIIKAFYS